MTTNYPAGTDTFTLKIDGVTDVMAADINNLQDSVVAIQNSVVKKGGDTMTGSLNIQNTAPTLVMTDTDQGTSRYLHVNSNLMGFLNTNAGWDMYVNNVGQMWTSNYGWLHDNFFRSVTNCGGSINAINCYGGGNIVSGYHDELIDNGGTVQIRTVKNLTNCDCVCVCA